VEVVSAGVTAEPEGEPPLPFASARRREARVDVLAESPAANEASGAVAPLVLGCEEVIARSLPWEAARHTREVA
jgi:hypothetical protein